MQLRNNDPIGEAWVIAPVLADLPPIARISEVDADPKALPLWVGWLLVLLLSLGLWGLIWGALKLIL